MQNYAIKSERVHTVNQLLKAYTLFEKDDEYVVIDNKVKIVDEQTWPRDGRAPLLRWTAPGHRSKGESEGGSSYTDICHHNPQNFFRMYSKLAGMTGTAETEAGEFWDIL